MSNQEELIRLENIFIDLKNQGKSIEDIFDILKVEKDLISSWDKSYLAAIESMPKDSPVKVTIKGKDTDGKYILAQSLSITMSVLEKVKFDLLRHSLVDETQLVDNPNKENFLFLSTKSKDAHEILTKYVLDLKIKENEKNEINFSYKLNDNSDEISKRVGESLEFYFKTIYTFERLSRQGQLITNASANYSIEPLNSLPIAIKTIAVKNYLGIKDIYLENISTDSKWIFITGENGFGKTVFLQSLALGLFGTKDNDTSLLDDFSSHINIEFKRYNESHINNIWSTYGLNKLDELACYGPSRLQVNAEETKNEISKKNTTTYSLFNPNGVLLDIELELLISKLSNPDLFKSYQTIFKTLIPTLEEIVVSTSDKTIFYREKDIENNKSFDYLVTFNQLASGIRSLIAMVGDMIIRLSKSQPNKSFSELAGIVIIDEIDLHWHPKWQREIPKILSEIFPNIQFIATTHSPLPLLGAPKNSLFLKVERNYEDGIQCRKVDIDIEKLLPNAIFTSPLFDMDSITNINVNDLSEINTNDNYPEIEKQKIIKHNIKKFEKGNEKFPDELFK